MVRVLVNGLRLRVAPNLDASATAELMAGLRVRVVEGPRDADGYRWYQVKLMPSGTTGWVAIGDGSSRWIAPVANGLILATSGRNLWILDDGGSRTRFYHLRRGWFAAEPSWSPDGRAVAIRESRQDDTLGCIIEGRITVLDGAGHVVARTSPPAGTFDMSPMWSPDGEELAFTREKHTCATLDRRGFPDLYAISAAGGRERLVIPDATNAAWSPLGDVFAFIRFDASHTAFAGDLRGPEIWTIDADGRHERRIGGRFDDGGRERLQDHVAWAPDGTVLVYARAVGADLDATDIDLIDRAGHIRPLTRVAGGVRDLSWLPDGDGLVFTHERPLRTSVVVLNDSGDELLRFELTGGPDQLALGVPDQLTLAPDATALAWGIQGSSKVRVQPLSDEDARTFQVASSGLSWQTKP
jgi:Tol biopolymer transport system component